MTRSILRFAGDFIFGTGKTPDIAPFKKAVEEMNDVGATVKSVHNAWKLWRQYLHETLWALPLHRRLTTFMPCSYQSSLLGWIAFLVENNLIVQGKNGIEVLIKNEDQSNEQ